jgi:hypothetical protein
MENNKQLKYLNLYEDFINKSPRSLVRQQIKSIKKEGYTPQLDTLFEKQCTAFLTDKISINEFESYLDKDLGLDLINENFLDFAKEVAVKFFQRVFNKIKIFFSTIFNKMKEGKEKVMELLCTIVDKIMSGLKKFGKWIKENKKGLYTLLVKLVVSLGITSVVSYILSMFGAGWVTAMGVKMGSSIVNKKVSSSVAKSVVKEKKFNHLKNYQKLFESTKDTLLKIGDGLKKFFSVLRKFKIAVLIFFGVVFILNLIFDPIFDSILSIANMSHLSDVFSNGFSVPEPTKIPKIDIEKIESEPIKTNINIKLDLGNTGKEYVNNVDETSGELTKSLQTSINDASKNISENPEMVRKNVANIVNQLHEEVKNSEPATIEDITTEKANDLDDETIKKDLLDMGTEKNVDDIENIINLDKPEINSSVLNLFKNNTELLDKDSQDFFNNNGNTWINGTTNEFKRVVTLNGLKVELENAQVDMKDGNITNIKTLFLNVTKEDGTKIEIRKTVYSDTHIFSSSLKPIDGYKEMTYNEYEGKGYGIRADVKDLSEKAYKKIWIKEYEQKDAEDIFKKLGIKDSNSKLESPPTPTPVTKVWDSNLSKDEMSNLDYDIYKKINKMSIEDLKQKYTEIIGSSDKLEENDMKLALAKYSVKNPNYKF